METDSLQSFGLQLSAVSDKNWADADGLIADGYGAVPMLPPLLVAAGVEPGRQHAGLWFNVPRTSENLWTIHAEDAEIAEAR